jgi:phospholipase D1/2
MNNSPYMKLHQHSSFAPLRKDCQCKWYVDGEEYFQDLYDLLNTAVSEVYITDWWLSPELFLQRPVN